MGKEPFAPIRFLNRGLLSHHRPQMIEVLAIERAEGSFDGRSDPDNPLLKVGAQHRHPDSALPSDAGMTNGGRATWMRGVIQFSPFLRR